MQYLDSGIHGDLTYSDVFLVPNRSSIASRYEVDLASDDATGMQIPIVAANMNAVTGPRLAATLARRGGLGVLPQDMPPQELLEAIRWVKEQPIVWDSPYRISAEKTVADALEVLPAIPGFGFVITEARNDIGVVPSELLAEASPEQQLKDLLREGWFALDAEATTDARQAFLALEAAGKNFAVVTKRGHIIGTVSAETAVRSAIYKPNVDREGRLAVAAALGVSGDIETRAKALVEVGVDVLVLDTAHGHQDSMVKAVERVSVLDLGVPLVAGNVVTAAAVKDLVGAGANIVKVGVGPGAMCTTRMMTAVGRPQFSAVLETAETAKLAGAHVWADGGVRYPRDVALALAAGSSAVMIGSWFSGTIESPGILRRYPDGSMFKTNWGMASTKAVEARFARLDPFERKLKAMFSEGISESKVAVDPLLPSVENLVDRITSGIRSSFSYAGAATLAEFREKAVVGVQSAAGYEEGHAKEHINVGGQTR